VTDHDRPNEDLRPRPAVGGFGSPGGRLEPPSARRRFFAGGLIGRDGHVVTVSAALLFGLVLLVAGLEMVRVSPLWGFTYDGAINGVISQLGTTGPAAILMLVATAANVLAGAIVLRLLGAPAFRGPSELALAGFACAVVIDATTLFLLGSVGLFGWPELLALHALIAAAWIAARRGRPLLGVPLRLRTVRPAAWWLLVLAVWAGPLIVQLASPAVPFQDVLPNHVAPVEHVRVFGSFSTLTTSPSPIYGPSRLMLGYVALFGQLTTITNLDAVLAEAAFALPLTILMALAVRRLAGELFGGSASFWILLTFPLTFTFMRIPDSRDTVVVFPLAALALSTIAAELRARRRSGRARPAPSSGRSGPDRVAGGSRLPDLALAFALGGGFLVHPLVGLISFTTAIGALILYPTELARRLLPAVVGGGILALPQVLTMSAIDAPSWVGAICVAAGVGVAFAGSFLVEWLAGRLASRHNPTASIAFADVFATRASDIGRVLLVGGAIVALLVVAAWRIPPSNDPTHPADPAGELMVDFPHLVWLALGGAALSAMRLRQGWVLLGCGIAAGVAAWTASGFVGYANLTEQAIHYEVPKSVEYWLPVMLAIGAAGALAAVCRQRRLGILRTAAISVFLLVAIYPITQPLATNVQIGEHRAAESVGLALREAERGYWGDLDYPDSRHIIDAQMQAVVDELRAEEQAGRLGPDTRVLNIADSFQQWASVPVGVFTGALETSISSHPEVSIHTEGGRLLGFDQLDQQLADGYGYVLLEPANLSGDVLAQTQSAIALAGYRQMWANSQATIYTKP